MNETQIIGYLLLSALWLGSGTLGGLAFALLLIRANGPISVTFAAVLALIGAVGGPFSCVATCGMMFEPALSPAPKRDSDLPPPETGR